MQNIAFSAKYLNQLPGLRLCNGNDLFFRSMVNVMTQGHTAAVSIATLSCSHGGCVNRLEVFVAETAAVLIALFGAHSYNTSVHAHRQQKMM